MEKIDLSKIKTDESIFDYQNLDDSLKNIDDSIELIFALLICCGFIDIKVVKRDSSVSFSTSESKVLVRYLMDSNLLEGDQSESIRVAYSTVQAIEKRLHEHVLLPPKLRRKSVEIVCQNIGITLDLFSSINRNWGAIQWTNVDLF